MNPDESNSPYATIDAKLAEVIDTLPDRPGWHERWQHLAAGCADLERLAVYQAIRDSRVVPEDAGFYLISWQMDAMVDERAETALAHLEEHLRVIEAAHGLEEEDLWEAGEAPAEYKEALQQYHHAWERLFADQLDAHGEHTMAALFRADRDEYERRTEAGRQFFFGSVPEGEPDVSDFLESLFDAIAAGLTPESPMGPLGFRWREEEDFWEIDAYPTPVELIGGATDGAVVTPGFSLDLEQLRSAFDQVEDLGWNALGWPDGDGPFIWLEGVYQGHDIFLRVLSEAPEGEEPGAKLRLPPKEPD
jgi:hypothetical protein